MNYLFNSPRLNFKEFNTSDASWFKELNDDPDVIKYTGDSAFESVAEAKLFLDNYTHYTKHGFGRWSVFLINSKEPIGWCGLKLNEENQIDVGFRFFKKYWNMGYATEACIAAINYGFQELHIIEIIGRTSKDNIAAQRVLEKAGLKFWKNANAHGIKNANYYKISNSFIE